ncbi:MAG: zinc ribbon domain-containing protein [Oligoflexus sp.]
MLAGPWFPTSKLCSTLGCSHLVQKLPLNTRERTCPACGTRYQRDLNVAIHLENLVVICTVTACGASSDGGTKRPKRPRRSTSHAASKQDFNPDSEYVPLEWA